MRANGIGLASGVGRLGGIAMPWLVVYLNAIGLYLPYALFGIIAGGAAIFTFLMPFDTYNRELDAMVLNDK